MDIIVVVDLTDCMLLSKLSPIVAMDTIYWIRLVICPLIRSIFKGGGPCKLELPPD